MLAFLIRRPIAVVMSLLALLALAVYLVIGMPVGLLPDIPIPRITVQVSYPGLAADEMERQIVRALRNQLLQVGRLEDIRSRAWDNQALIEIDLAYGANTQLAFIEVNEKIDQAMPLLPEDVERPRVIQANVSDLPVFYLDMIPAARKGKPDPLELAQFARSVIKRRIEQLEAVAFVDLSGLALPEITVLPDGPALRRLGIDEADLERIFRENDLQVGSIIVQAGQYRYKLVFRSELRRVEDVADLYFRVGDRLFRLGDLARVALAERPRRGSYLRGREAGIIFSVRKQADGNLFELKTEMDTLLADLRHRYPTLDFQLSLDQSELLRVSIRNLWSSLGYGALFAGLILLAFFREWRAPLLIAAAVPVTLLLTLFGFALLGLTVNTISLAGLILGVGLMVDNSIIVIENIRQYRRQGLPPAVAGIRGAGEVIRPLVSSALTTCSVFLPLIFLSGLAGALFYDQAVSVSLALGASLLVAWLVLPTLHTLLDKNTEPPASTDRPASWFERSVDWSLRYRWVVWSVVVAVIGAGVFCLQKLDRERFPRLTRQGIELLIDWNEPLSLAENEARYHELYDHFAGRLESAHAFVGRQQFLLEADRQGEAAQKLFLLNADDWAGLLSDIPAWTRRRWPQAIVEARPTRNLFDQVFGEEKPPLIIHLTSQLHPETPTPQQVTAVPQLLRQMNLSFRPPAEQFQYLLDIDREAALRYGLPVATIQNRVRSLLGQQEIGRLRFQTGALPVVVQNSSTGLRSDLETSLVATPGGDQLPLSRFIRLLPHQAYRTITATRAGPSYDIQLDAYSPGLEEEVLSGLKADGQLAAFFSGQVYANRMLLRELAWTAAVSLALLYLILAAQFESFRQPLIVLLTVPVGVAVALLTLFITRESLNLVSMIGLVVMSGIVVNDAILKVDMINRARRAGHTLQEALHEGGRRRLRPILMTTFTTVLALSPVLFSAGLGAELQRPLAWTVIGGLLAGTLASLYFIPLLYVFFSGRK